jgi:hypothetical protein
MTKNNNRPKIQFGQEIAQTKEKSIFQSNGWKNISLTWECQCTEEMRNC